jgi:hypothetical protein
VRRQIVEHLTRAHREVPTVTFVEECDFTGVDLPRLVPEPVTDSRSTPSSEASRRTSGVA